MSKDLREGMYFQIERVRISGKIFEYKALYFRNDYSEFIPQSLLEEAFDRNLYIIYSDNNFQLAPVDYVPVEQIPENIDLDFIHNCYSFKPKALFMSELKWKLLIRNLLKGKNIMLTGHAGTGKTVAAKYAAKTLNRPFFMFRVGAMQDPRSSLIGNTFYKKEKGTYFRASRFITAIQTPNALICLDELSRAHPEAHNILLSVLDPEQKCISLDENDIEYEEDNIIYVADGVSFVATANMGNEYTGTRQIDRANIDRFSYIEIDMLNKEEEFELVMLKFPKCDQEMVKLLCEISASIKKEYLSDSGSISNMMSTRMVLEAAELIEDGFTIGEALTTTIVPLFDPKGGASSERTYLLTMINTISPRLMNKKSTKSKSKEKISPANPFSAI